MTYPNIPAQLQGDFQDIVSMKCGDSTEVAIESFRNVYERFIAVNEWHCLSDDVKTKFTIFDSETKQPAFDLKVGNFIRLDIPGPGSPSGSGYDWTQIIDLQDEMNSTDQPFIAFTIKPCPSPESDKENAAHFYTEKSSNTFIIRRIGTCIYAEVHGRNEIENTEDVPLLDTLRNKAISIGSKMGVGGLNWLAFTKSVLDINN